MYGYDVWVSVETAERVWEEVFEGWVFVYC